ncbi:YrzI family small protein [Bacillus massiliigorillae]|nr:YrzI family small protein [Bacillus massiliigorillae]
MTINLIFFTVTFKRKKITAEEALHQERIKKIFEENATKISKFGPFM